MTVSFSGMSSGIDTQSIISALVSVEGMQQDLLERQQTTRQKTADAYTALITKLGSLSTAAATVADTKAWAGTTATSSSTSVTATATGTTGASLTFNVTKLAAAHTLISSGSATSTSDVVAGGGTINVTAADGTPTDLSVGTGTLSEVVNAINSSSTGLVASAVQISAGAYRLQVASKTTGENSSFTMSGFDGFTGMNVLTTGSDATIHVGDDTTGYDADSTSNTFSSLVSGLSFTVSKLETGVTVSSAVDGTAVATTVSALVTAANAALSYIDSSTAWDSTTKSASPLNGESSVRLLKQKVLSMIGSANASGVTLTSTGELKFDQTAFLAAFSADPAKVARQFGASATFLAAADAPSSSVTFSSSTKATRAGSYAVNITQPAAREKWSIDTSGTIENLTVALSRGTSSIAYTAATGEDLATSVAGINGELAAAGLGIVAAVSGNSITFTAASAGSSRAFTTSLDGVDGTQVTAGQDVVGTIDGQSGTGSGNVLSLATGTGGAVGMSLVVDTTAADIAATSGDIGLVTFAPGLAQQLQQLVSNATDTTSGTLASGQKSANAQVKDLQDQIDSWTRRLGSYRARLVSQFTAMETSINTLKTSLSALGGLITSTSDSSSG